MKTTTILSRNTRTLQRATASNLKAHGLKAIASRLKGPLGWSIAVSGTMVLKQIAPYCDSLQGVCPTNRYGVWRQGSNHMTKVSVKKSRLAA